ncbi:hypothetical protein SapgrDRAFT_0014 [Saprospira grandis DSM 2844]|uniref:DUF4856 domain-containing protein n=1 Tax=Saprospira grandis DSM 2844 TaxID=694433 RepID=J1HZH1_9BACT|nr:DUF4856 domain-containing protein [Saprospira grandis]EJF51780.1 hypothetical protein SapgrDRAFT_0014 [Saprospira grandis DSM 2844]
MNLASLQKALLILAVFGLGLSSCKKDESSYDVPETYSFENVSYSGQTDRLDMLGELAAYAKSASALSATALDANSMKDMFANQNDPFADADLNASSKQLKSKTVSTEQTVMEDLMDALATASLYTDSTASSGLAGIMQTNDGASSYLLNANGLELAQVIEKGIMGACFYYQATAVYMGSGKMDVDNETVVEGEGTEMEHHWDEAFGYFGAPTDYPSNTTGIRFWGKYADGSRQTYLSTGTNLMNALIEGRAAISAQDLDERDAQIAIAREQWELVLAGSALHYINKGIANLSDDAAAAHHSLSEAYAFVYGLKFGGLQTLSTADVDAILLQVGNHADPLQANLYNSTSANLQAAKTALVNAFPALASVQDQL